MPRGDKDMGRAGNADKRSDTRDDTEEALANGARGGKGANGAPRGTRTRAVKYYAYRTPQATGPAKDSAEAVWYRVSRPPWCRRKPGTRGNMIYIILV